MANRAISLLTESVPYLRRLRPVTGSVTATLLMRQLEYWFERHPQGFYKFMSPCDHSAYRAGDSWEEELGFSAKEFRGAFDAIGVRYSSKKEFDEAPNKFMGQDGRERFYCSYYHRLSKQTYYVRNDATVDLAISRLLEAESTCTPAQKADGEMPKGNLATCPKGISTDAQRADGHLPKGNLAICPKGISNNTETTPETTAETTPETTTKKNTLSVAFATGGAADAEKPGVTSPLGPGDAASDIADTPAKAKKSKKKPLEECTPGTQIRRHFEQLWAEKYNEVYYWSEAESTHAKKIYAACNRDLNKALGAVEAFLDDDRPYLSDQRHRFALLLGQINTYKTPAPDRSWTSAVPERDMTPEEIEEEKAFLAAYAKDPINLAVTEAANKAAEASQAILRKHAELKRKAKEEAESHQVGEAA
jgi:hypothetical protein